MASFLAATAVLLAARHAGRLQTALQSAASTPSPPITPARSVGGPPRSTVIAQATATLAPTAPGTGRRVGILAGHWQYDTGTVCPDGRREVDVTIDIALRVQAILEASGYTVDILPEHDPEMAVRPGVQRRSRRLACRDP